MTRPACAVAVALASPLVGVAAGVATHTGSSMAAAFAVCLIAAPFISPPAHSTRPDAPEVQP